MKKILIFLATAGLFTACSSDIELTKPDNFTEEIQFSVASIYSPATANMAKAVTRAGEHKHITWNDAKHANTLGVFGYGDESLSNVIFNNQKATATYADSKWFWRPSADKYWAEFTQYSSFDFFGYMLENATTLPTTATVTKSGNAFTLSFPAALSSPILLSGDNTPLICHAPHRTTVPGFAIPFEMDQTLTGYDIQFQLGDKMSNLRYFVIKSVKIYVDDLPVGGTVSRTYTLSDGKWSETQAPVTWTGVTKYSVSAASAVAIASDWVITDKENAGYAANLAARTISSSTDWVKWGDDGDPQTIDDGAFYAIPHADFTPTIEVTYDVYAKANLNGDNTTITRKEVTSTIVLNKENFNALISSTGTTGEIQHIKIKIVPDYLYVLSDDDQTTGFLIVGRE